MKITKIGFAVFLTWVLWMCVFQYLFCFRYDTILPTPFSGERLYNPYEGVDSSGWMKCNFHAHTRAWGGLTNGHGTAADIHRAYDSLGYSVHTVSNYLSIDTSGSSLPSYLPAYEHGLNLQKTHQLVLGSSRVNWLDYLLPQTWHNKQHVLQSLKEDNVVLVMNHPALRNGYAVEDAAQLAGYDCMEVFNPSVTSVAHWDAALSAGRKVFIVGNDDIHDVIRKKRLGVMCTFLHAKSDSAEHVLEALRDGRSYGVSLGKGENHSSIPTMEGFVVRNDSVFAKMTAEAEEVVVYGQGGRELARSSRRDSICYQIKPQDHYARIVFRFESGTEILLNPVFYISEAGYTPPGVFVDWGSTLFYRAIGVMVLALWILLLINIFSRGRSMGYRKRTLVFR